jgi:hypothetical protein
VTAYRVAAVALIALVATAVLALHGVAPAGGSSPVVSLGVQGRSNTAPWVAADGAFVAVAWGASTPGSDVFVATSRDAGRTFGAPVQVNTVPGEARLSGELAPRVALAPAAGGADPEISVLWTARGEATAVKMARSRDGGRTFAAPVALQSPGAPGDRGWAALAVDRQGTAHAIWLDHRGMAAGRVGGHTHAGHHAVPGEDGVAMALKSGLYYATSNESGSHERQIANGVCYCCKTALAVSGDGALYAAWRHVYPGSFRDMALSVSRDGGRSFSAPARVSEDGWSIDGCPDDGPAIAVDGGGTVHIVWPTVVGGPAPEGALFHASTRDGLTFTPRTRIPTLGGPQPLHPQVAIDRTGRIVVAWDELIEGRRVAAARELRLRPHQAVEFRPAVILSSDGPAMYPVLAATRAGVLAVWTTGGEPSAIRARVIPLP